MDLEQHEVEGVAEAEVVLSDVSEAVQGREWVQVPHHVRVTSEAASAVWRQPWQVSPQLQ